VIRSPDELACAPCFSGSRAGLIMGFTCGSSDLELGECDVVDCVYDSMPSSSLMPSHLQHRCVQSGKYNTIPDASLGSQSHSTYAPYRQFRGQHWHNDRAASPLQMAPHKSPRCHELTALKEQMRVHCENNRLWQLQDL